MNATSAPMASVTTAASTITSGDRFGGASTVDVASGTRRRGSGLGRLGLRAAIQRDQVELVRERGQGLRRLHGVELERESRPQVQRAGGELGRDRLEVLPDLDERGALERLEIDDAFDERTQPQR